MTALAVIDILIQTLLRGVLGLLLYIHGIALCITTIQSAWGSQIKGISEESIHLKTHVNLTGIYQQPALNILLGENFSE